MPATKLENHSTSLILKAIEEIVSKQGFKFNEDLSDTQSGKASKKEFKLFLSEAERHDSSSRQNFRISGTFELELMHNGQGGTNKTLLAASDDVENIIFDIERFAPDKFIAAKSLIHSTQIERWSTQPYKSGSDAKLKTTLIFTIIYRIRNPNAT